MENTSVSKVEYQKGLDGVIAGETTICSVDGVRGNLFYRGYNIYDLVENSTYEEVAYLLLNGTVPTRAQLQEFTEKLLKYRRLHPTILKIMQKFPHETHPMKVIQSCIAALGAIWDNKDGEDADETYIAYISQFPLIAAGYYRMFMRLPIVLPSLELSTAANFLYMLTGTVPPPDQAALFDKALILHMEHGFNASTFTARVVASSMASVSASLSAAVGSLAGPLHGGANERVMEMVSSIGTAEKATSWVDAFLARKGKIPGMGHRVYKVKDPRAIIMQKWLFTKAIRHDDASRERVAILDKVESHFLEYVRRENKKVYPNVDFYSGLLFTNLGISPIMFTPIFGVARIVGWCAHIKEQWEDNRIYRPESLFSGQYHDKFARPGEGKVAEHVKKRVAIIDDDPDLVEAMKMPLEANHYEVVSHMADQGALEFVQGTMPDVLLLDVMFPENVHAGFEIAVKLRENERTRRVPIIMFSSILEKFSMHGGGPFATAPEELKARLEANKPEHFVAKPVDPQNLLALVGSLVDKKS